VQENAGHPDEGSPDYSNRVARLEKVDGIRLDPRSLHPGHQQADGFEFSLTDRGRVTIRSHHGDHPRCGQNIVISSQIELSEGIARKEWESHHLAAVCPLPFAYDERQVRLEPSPHEQLIDLLLGVSSRAAGVPSRLRV
jgi:hypothetical protein